MASLVSLSSFELMVRSDNVPKSNVGGMTPNIDREIVIYFNNVREPIIAQKKVNTRNICLLNSLPHSSSQDQHETDWVVKLLKNNWINYEI